MNIQITLYVLNRKKLTSVSVGIFIPCEIAPTICKEIREEKYKKKLNTAILHKKLTFIFQ